MPQFRHFPALLFVITSASVSAAQGSSASNTPLHLPVNSFEFVATVDKPAQEQPLRIHNGGNARFTDVRITRLVYADSARGAGWLVALPRQTSVAPDELATVGTLCIDATRLSAGTYRATAAVAAREVPEPVAITIKLIVKDAGAARALRRCGIPATK